MKHCLTLWLLVVVYHYAHAQTKHYVKQAAAGTGTGLGSWANAAGAAQLQGIIAAAAAGDTVWVAAGVYHPTAYPALTTGGTTNRDFAFTLTPGVAVYGGFAGTETLLSQRNVATNITSLSGDIGAMGVMTDNCFHVIATNNCSNTAILDGFKIDSAYADSTGSVTTTSGQAFSRSEGAGICAMQSEPTISNCTFITNQSTSEGGAIYFSNCSAMPITNCSFTSNVAGGNGGAISKETASPFTFTNCTFTSNRSNVAAGTTGGGAIYSTSGSNDVITYCTFTGNASTNGYGGALFYNGTSNLTMTHTTIAQNNAFTYGGGMADLGGTSFVVDNCNVNNNASASGGGIYSTGGSSTYAYDTLANNTATATTGPGGGGFLVNGVSSVISHCWFHGNVTNGSAGAGQCDSAGATPTDSNTVFQANIAKGTASLGGGYYHTSGNGSFVNCVFVDNSCTGNGGGYYNNSTQPVENCTFYNNSAGAAFLGGGFYDVGGEGPKIYNNMIWNNTPDDFYSGGSTASLKLKYNDFAEAASYPAGGSIVGNIAQAPTFLNSGNYAGTDGIWATSDDGLHLTSPARTGGADGVPPNGTNGSYGWAADDVTDAVRPDAGADSADMGAYEGGGIPLALELLSFSAAATATNTAVISWQVASPGQALSYDIQRSSDAIHFETIASREDADNRTSYTFTDYDDTSAVMYYRLLINLPGGTTSYSAIAEVRNGETIQILQLRPSISTSSTTTLYIGGSSRAETMQVVMIDILGRTFVHQPLAVTQGDNTYLLDVSHCPVGVYYLTITDGNGFRKILSFEKP